MKRNAIGTYQDDSGKKYEVIALVQQIKSTTVSSGVSTYADGASDYKTVCGLELNVGKNGTFVALDGTVLTPV